MQYLLLGPTAVVRDGKSLALGGLLQRTVLAALLLSSDRPIDVDTLVDRVWPHSPPAKPIASVRSYIANLRRILADDRRSDRVVTDGGGYRLTLGTDTVDTDVFERLSAHSRRLLDNGDHHGASMISAQALGLWRGAPLADCRDHDWVQDEIRRLEAVRTDVVETHYEAELLMGGGAELVSGLQSEIDADPLREALWGQLMVALHRAGRRADAVQTFQRLRETLADELGVSPSATMQRLAEAVQAESVELEWKPSQAAVSVLRQRTLGGTVYGRDRELHQLRDTLLTARRGHGHIAVLAGESGVGKTAIALEIAHLADHLGFQTAWVGHAAGLCTPPAWEWSQVMRGLDGESDSVDHTFGQAVEEGFARTEAIANRVVELARKRPTFVVLDDLQRGDPATFDVLEIIASLVPRLPLLVLATWQDGSGERPLADQQSDFDRVVGRSDAAGIHLRGIARTAAGRLIESVAGIVPDPRLVAEIESRTGGNPLYIKELTKLLRDSGLLDTSTSTIPEINVPDAVLGVVRRRTAALDADTRSAMVVASMVGTEFSTAVVAAALGLSDAQAARVLEPAQRLGLVAGDGPGRQRFSHGIVRDAISAQSTGAAREPLHADIARAYAARRPTTIEEQLAAADHAWHAGVALRADTALLLLDQARSAAWHRSAYGVVATLCKRALQVCSRLEPGDKSTDREVQLRVQLVAALAVTEGQNSTAVRAALQQLAETRSGRDQFTLEAAFSSLEASGSGRYREAGSLADGLIAMYRHSSDPPAGSAGYYLRGLVDFFLGHLEESRSSIAYLLDDVPVVDWRALGHLAAFDVRGYGIAAWMSAVSGDREATDSWVQHGLGLADSRGDLFGRALVRLSALQGQAILGESEGVAALARTVYDELTELGVVQLATSAQIIEGWALALDSPGLDTADQIRTAIDRHSVDGTRIFLPMYYALLADAELAQGRSQCAAAAVELGKAVAEATGERVWDRQLAVRIGRVRTASVAAVPISL